MGAIGIGTPIYYHSTPIRPGAVVDKPEFVFEVLVSNAGDTIDLETKNGSNVTPNFIINWGEGSDQTLSTTTPSHTYASTGTYVIKINKPGTNTPVNNFSVLATSQGKAMVKKITSWGDNDWYSLDSAFKDCVNLTSFDTGEFKGLASIDLTSCFEECTSLASIDIRNWDISLGSTLYRFAFGCVLVENLYLPKLTPRTGSWSQAFSEVGTSVTDGCIFHFKELNFTGGSLSTMEKMFEDSRINPLSNFTNWVFGTGLTGLSTLTTTTSLFRSSVITGEDPVLDVSGWTDFNPSTNASAMFYEINGGPNLPAANGIDIYEYTLNISNLNTSTVTIFSNAFANSTGNSTLGLKNIIGLSTLIASPLITTIGTFMYYQRNLAIDPLDNLSDAFMNSLDLSLNGFGSSFRNVGSLLTSSYGAAPNLAELDLSAQTTIVNTFRSSRFSTNLDFSSVTFGPNIILHYTFNNIVFSNTDSHLNFPGTMTISGANAMDNAFSNAIVRKISFSNNVDFSQCDDFSVAFSSVKGSEDADPATTDINLPTNMSFAGADLTSLTTFSNMFYRVKGPGSTGTVPTLWNALNPCQTNNLLRALANTLDTPGLDADIVLNNCKYSGPQALVSNDYNTLISNNWTFGTLASEDPYFSIPNYISPGGTTQNITFATGVATDGTWTVTNGVATIDNSTPASPTITAATNGNGVIRYTLTDGCYNEVNFTATIPLIANNFSFNFDGINNYLQVSPQSNFAYGTGDFTISSWIYPERINDTYELIWSQGGGASNGTNYLSLFNDQLAYYDGFNHQIVSPAGSIKDNEWQQVAIRRTSGITQLFINGIPSGNSSTVQDESIAQPTAVTIGKWSIVSGLQHNFKGRMDELFIYNIALTNPQILDIYNGRLGVTNETIDLSKYDGLGGNLVYWNRMGD